MKKIHLIRILVKERGLIGLVKIRGNGNTIQGNYYKEQEPMDMGIDF